MSISKYLGKTTEYPTEYSADILVREPRERNRVAHNINSDLFVGRDAWNVYEISFLTNNGLPINGVGRLVYSSDNEYIVESKSLKLYFFSYNMLKLGDTVSECVERFTQQVTNDLTQLLETNISFLFYYQEQDLIYSKAYPDYLSIDNHPSLENIVFDVFNEDPSLLQVVEENQVVSQRITTNKLRSNCKITNQPDWGDLYVYYKGNKSLLLDSLVKYIVSFRNENHFHEEVVEMCYNALYNVLQPDELLVGAQYTRRGGIDINPVRATHVHLVNDALVSNTLNTKTFRQ